MSLRSKLILTFLAFSAALVLCVTLLVKWSFHRGFSDFVAAQRQVHLQQAADSLGRFYQAQGSWEPLRRRQRAMARALRPPDWGTPDDTEDSLPPPPREFFHRLYLLDANGEPVAGPSRSADPTAPPLPIMVAGKTVGYLGLSPRHRALNEREARFARQQGRQLMLIALAAVVLSLLFAWPLSRVLVARLEQLGQGLRRLSAGDLDTRVTPRGRDELAQLAEHLNHLAGSLQQSEQARRKWVADISHELRTPLATLRAQLEAIEDGVHAYNQQTEQRLLDQTKRLQQLTEDLYQLSLADAGALQYRKRHQTIRPLLEQALAEFAPRLHRAGLSLETAITLAPDLTLLVDAERLHQLLGNLLENSLRYTSAPGIIRVQARVENNRFKLEILDSAPGVAPQHLPHLFDRFFRVEGSRNRDQGGAGLGLNLCRSIVAAHGGEISAGASPLGGLSITITLPLQVI